MNDDVVAFFMNVNQHDCESHWCCVTWQVEDRLTTKSSFSLERERERERVKLQQQYRISKEFCHRALSKYEMSVKMSSIDSTKYRNRSNKCIEMYPQRSKVYLQYPRKVHEKFFTSYWNGVKNGKLKSVYLLNGWSYNFFVNG